MKIIRRRDHYGDLVLYNERKVQEYKCSNEKCRQVVYEGYKICPHCGQRR